MPNLSSLSMSFYLFLGFLVSNTAIPGVYTAEKLK